MPEDEIISVLIGLVSACNNNPKTENTDRLIIKALAFPVSAPERHGSAAEEIVEELRAEKNTLAPGCALCTMPCGNTSDYDMNGIYTAADEIRTMKLQILSELRGTAASIYQNKQILSEAEIELFYKALFYIRLDMRKETLSWLLEEVQAFRRKITAARYS